MQHLSTFTLFTGFNEKTGRYLLLLLLLLSLSNTFAQNKPVKNVILLIPDGTSLSAVSAARWYQRYLHPEQTHLYIDPYLCGTVLTYSSNAPIGDSAPTTSCYMTGYPSLAGWVATYPPADPENDIIPMGVYEAYQPVTTLLEAARIIQNKATGLVFTCEFPHATPADCSAHSYDRGKYEWIVPQMVHNKIDVVIGGGAGLLTDNLKTDLLNDGYGVFTNDIAGFRNYAGNRMWALFGNRDISYDLDRDPSREPSIAEMTAVALDKLSKNENGFILMVEGSKVDWAAHDNDAVGIITEMLAFDKACGVAFDFAGKNGETVVLVVPDHGNSGFSIGTRRCPNYSTMSKDELFGPIAQFKATRKALVAKLQKTEPAQLKETVYEWTGISLSDSEYHDLLQAGDKLDKVVAKVIENHICFGFTTGGHTGEEVFLAVYDPTPNRLMGHHTNIEVNHYLRRSLGLPDGALDAITQTYFVKHTDVFKGYSCTINNDGKFPVLKVKHKKHQLEIPAYTDTILHNGKAVKLNSVVVYVDKNNTFYLPRSIAELLAK
ncbi:MAG: alkaline phosphatase [Dysgonamonadaceae bacterium]|jgi:alkaline phosphatase|nr:alkaline phosphatase [Dysgonamonadaceae bacterium]